MRVLLAAGCGGDGSSESQRLDGAVAERLAAQSDAVADAIEANDGCAAEQRAAELRSSLDEAAVPVAIRREVERVATRTFTCNPPPPPPPPPPVVSTEDEDDDDHGEGKGKKHKKGKKHGHEKDED
jgi:hypothetical protein